MADSSPKAFYVTTPIYYVNDAPHIGHAYTTVAGDVLTRWHRQRGERRLVPDRHRRARREGHAHRRGARRDARRSGPTSSSRPRGSRCSTTLDVANDDFIRTTEPRHTERVQEFWQTLHDTGDVYEGTYEGPYCVGCEEFKLAGELLDGRATAPSCCPIHGTPGRDASRETNYFFRLSAYADRLLAHYDDAARTSSSPSQRAQRGHLVRQQGLQDLSISPVDASTGASRSPGTTTQVLYVWIDALLNYVDRRRATAPTRSGSTRTLAGRRPPGRQGHPALPRRDLAGDADGRRRSPCRRQVFAHGWLLVGGEKMSKSKLTGIAPERRSSTHFGSDAFRYYFLRAIQFGQDGSFSWEDMTARYTAELANGLGNLASRVTAMVGKYFDGVLPAPRPTGRPSRRWPTRSPDGVEPPTRRSTGSRSTRRSRAVDDFVGAVNVYVTEQEPWKVAKDDVDAGPRAARRRSSTPPPRRCARSPCCTTR